MLEISLFKLQNKIKSFFNFPTTFQLNRFLRYYYFQMPFTPKYTIQQRAQFVIWFAEGASTYAKFKNIVQFEMGADAAVPHLRSVTGWIKAFLETGNVEDKERKRKK